MPRYTKKPVTIEAMQLSGGNGQCMAVAEWMADNGYPWLVGNALKPETLRVRGYEDDEEQPTAGIWIDPADGSLMIRTLEGDMRVSLGDYVIRGVHGEFYPCKPDIFAKTYDAVDPEKEARRLEVKRHVLQTVGEAARGQQILDQQLKHAQFHSARGTLATLRGITKLQDELLPQVFRG